MKVGAGDRLKKKDERATLPRFQLSPLSHSGSRILSLPYCLDGGVIWGLIVLGPFEM